MLDSDTIYREVIHSGGYCTTALRNHRTFVSGWLFFEGGLDRYKNNIEDSNNICFQVLVLAGNPGFLIVVVPVAIQVSAPASSPVFPTEVQVVSGPS